MQALESHHSLSTCQDTLTSATSRGSVPQCQKLNPDCAWGRLQSKQSDPPTSPHSLPPLSQWACGAGYEPHSALPMSLPLLLCPFSPARPAAFRDVSTLSTSFVSLYSPPPLTWPVLTF